MLLVQCDIRLVEIRYAVDVRRPEVHDGLADILRMPFRFVAHELKRAYFGLRALGLPWPRSYACTWLAAKTLHLGRHHWRYEQANEVGARRAADEKQSSVTSLDALAREFAIPLARPEPNVHRFAHLSPTEQLNEADAIHCTREALTAARLYTHLRSALVEFDLEYQYDHIELPAAVALAEIERQGVTIDRVKLDLAHQAAMNAVKTYSKKLLGFGFSAAPGGTVVVTNAECERVLGSLGMLDLFRTPNGTSGYSFCEDSLSEYRERHRVIDLLHHYKKYDRLANDRLFTGEFIGTDGRVHSSIDPLGAGSGRPSFRQPNIVGVGKVFRPIVVPDGAGFGLAELDFSYQEVLIAAAHFDDDALLEDCRKGDPYLRMVGEFCAAELAPEDHALDDDALKNKYKSLRGRMKVITLAVMYGMGDDSVAAKAHLTLAEARQLRRRFFERYHRLAAGMERARRQLQNRGYSTTVTGMKRFRSNEGPLSRWEQRWSVNAPIQGGGACVLKLMLPRLAAYLAERGGRIVLPVFDAVVVQFPLAGKDEVLAGCRKIMTDAMRELYPTTQPRVDVNDRDVTCWNKDGHSDSIERFLSDPDFKP